MSYFQDTIVNIEANQSLRGPQKDAYLRIKSHFALNPSEQALVVLPTGTGKSGLICIAPYCVSNGRVLVITPGLVTKEAVSKELQALDEGFLLEKSVILHANDLPVVVEYYAGVQKKYLENANFVLTNIHKLQESKHSLANLVEPDFFDLIIIDEAHHSVANTWQQALKYFKSAKVLHLTGTPYRGDHQPIQAKEIHKTLLSDAMRAKFVKQLRNKELDNANLMFTIEGFSEPVGLEKVLELEEKEWIEKSVALSKECSVQVIKETIKNLKELRNTSKKAPHKILAVACGIDHAEDICRWYREEGLSAEVIHSKLEYEEKNRRFLAVERHECDVVVSVNMLMEGYNHKYLTVLGIFRPFRSLNAFAQIIGRVLRVLPEDEITHHDLDNNAIVIYHKQIGLSKQWEYFKKEVQKSKTQRKEYPDIEYDEYESRKIVYAQIQANDTFISDESSYLTDEDFHQKFEAAKEDMQASIDARLLLFIEGKDLAPDEIEGFRKVIEESALNKTREHVRALEKAKNPASAHKKLIEILNKTRIEGLEDVLMSLGYEDDGKEMFIPFKNKLQMTWFKPNFKNGAMIMQYLNYKCKKSIGVGVSEMSMDQLEKAIDFIKKETITLKKHFGVNDDE